MKFPHLEKFADLMKGGGWVGGGDRLGCVLVRGGVGDGEGWGWGWWVVVWVMVCLVGARVGGVLGEL